MENKGISLSIEWYIVKNDGSKIPMIVWKQYADDNFTVDMKSMCERVKGSNQMQLLEGEDMDNVSHVELECISFENCKISNFDLENCKEFFENLIQGLTVEKLPEYAKESRLARRDEHK